MIANYNIDYFHFSCVFDVIELQTVYCLRILTPLCTRDLFQLWEPATQNEFGRNRSSIYRYFKN